MSNDEVDVKKKFKKIRKVKNDERKSRNKWKKENQKRMSFYCYIDHIKSYCITAFADIARNILKVYIL